MICKKFNSFIFEKVYLFKTIFDSYEMIIDTYSKTGFILIGIEDEQYKIEIESYGDKEDKTFILREPSEISIMEDSKDVFTHIVNDILYILNKNELSYIFKIEEIDKQRNSTYNYAIIKCINKEKCTIEDLERIATTTKIMTKKIKDIGDLDKLIYKTK